VKLSFRPSLRGRLTLLLLVASAMLTGLAAWHFVDHRQERINSATEELLDHTRLIAVRQQAIVARADAILNGLMSSPELRAGVSTSACEQFLSQRIKQEPEFVQAGRTLPDGVVACVAVPPSGQVSYADRSWFQPVLHSRAMVIGQPETGHFPGKPAILFAKAMRDEARRVTGVLFLLLDLTWLQSELATNHLPEGSRLVVVDAKGAVVVHHPDPEALTGKSVAHLPLFQYIQSTGGEGTVEDIGLEGDRRLFAFAKLLDAVSGPMYVWVSVPKAVLEAPARREALIGLGIMLTVLAGVMGFTIWGGNRLMLQPLLTLSRTAARFGGGDFAARSGLPHSDDEIGRLARAMDETADAVADRERKLARANRALRVLSAGNRALVHTQGEQELLEEMCRAIVEDGGYRTAWVSYAGHDPQRSVRTVAACGAERDFLDGIKITWGETEPGRGPPGTAIHRGIPVVSNDIAADFAPWRELAQRVGFASVLALPLRLDGIVIGALCICAAEPGAFDEDVVKLLGESADDLAFGIATQRAEVEHGRARAALKTAEERFRAAAEASLDALFILKSVRDERGDILDFEFIDINARAGRMLGMARGQIIGQKLCELLPYNRTGGFFEKFVAVAATGTPLDEEFPIGTPEIKAKWLRHQVVRVGDGIAISSRDITVWKEAGRALKESENKFRDLVESVSDWVWEIDEKGIYTYCSPRVRDLLGYEPLELIGKSPFELMPAAEAEKVAAIFGVLVAERKPLVALENVNLRKDGREVVLETSGVPVFDSLGVFKGYRGIDRDITGRKQAERALVRANRALRTLSAGNAALVHATDELELLGMVCRVIVEEGGYRMAWVGYADDNPERTITPKAWAGIEGAYLSGPSRTWADTERGQGPNGRAIRSGEPQIVHDVMTDPGFAPWREQAIAHGYVAVFACPLRVGGRIIGSLGIYAAEAEAFDAGERDLLEELANDLAYGIETVRTRAERDRIAYAHTHHAEILQKSLEQSIQAIADTVEARDPYTAGHQRRVGELAVAIARELGLAEEKVHGIHLAAAIHDLGKIRVPAEILSKPGKLTDIEFMLMKTHPQAGYDILKDVDFPWPIADIVRQHHEKLDGSGYPQGLKGEAILLESRIMTVADVVEAMASHRPYRAALGIEVALKEIERGRDSAYDAVVVDACLKLFREEKFAFQG